MRTVLKPLGIASAFLAVALLTYLTLYGVPASGDSSPGMSDPIVLSKDGNGTHAVAADRKVGSMMVVYDNALGKGWQIPGNET